MVKFRPDWTTHLHWLRKTELEGIFSNYPQRSFDKGLEIGSGDCYQSGLLAEYVSHLTATEYSPEWLKGKQDTESVSYRVCDAERLEKYFEERQFDIVFSSNVLEHLPNPELALKGIHRVLKDDGITIHSMPAPFWKAAQLSLFYPHLLLYFIERIFEPGYITGKIGVVFGSEKKKQPAEPALTNNPKTPRPLYVFVPAPHGVSRTHWEELLKFGKKRWVREFEKAGFKVVEVRKGLVLSPYGFGWNGLRRLMGRLGIASEYIYIARKTGAKSRFLERLHQNK